MALLGNQADKAFQHPLAHALAAAVGDAREAVVAVADGKKEEDHEEEISCFGRWVPSKVLLASAAAAVVAVVVEEGFAFGVVVMEEEVEPEKTVPVGPPRPVAVVAVAAVGAGEAEPRWRGRSVGEPSEGFGGAGQQGSWSEGLVWEEGVGRSGCP